MVIYPLSQPKLGAVPGGGKGPPMPNKAKRAELAQKALDAYLQEHSGIRRWCYPPSDHEVGESDIVDLVTDLLLLAELRGHDPCEVTRKAEGHLRAEAGREC